jgi:hypothetical protein
VWIGRVRALMTNLGRHEAFATYVTNVRATHGPMQLHETPRPGGVKRVKSEPGSPLVKDPGLRAALSCQRLSL